MLSEAKETLRVLVYALSDERTPLLSKILISITIAYALSPLDLIPDFIPILGLLDDLLIVPLGIFLAIKLIPHSLFQELRKEAQHNNRDIPASLKTVGLIAVLLTWFLMIAAVTVMLS